MKHILFIALIIGSVACSKSDKKRVNTPVETIAIGDTITIEALGANMQDMRFDREVLLLPRNTAITIELKNVGTDPIMPHNIVIVNEGKGNDVGNRGVQFKDNDYVQPNDPQVIAHSAMAMMGETVYFSFKTPKNGNYDFICSYPGHWGRMKGKVKLQ